MRYINKGVQQYVLREIFRTWKLCKQGVVAEALSFGFVVDALKTAHRIGKSMQIAKQQLKLAMAADKKAGLQNVMSQFSEAATQSNMAKLYSKIRAICKVGNRSKVRSATRCIPQLRKNENQCAENRTEMSNVMMDHFAEVECGVRMSFEALCKSVSENKSNTIRPPNGFDGIPSLTETEHSIRQCKDCASGGDQIPGTVLKRNPKMIAQILHPLITKICITQNTPIQMKGGFLHPLWKQKDDPINPEAYRSVWITDQLSKCVKRPIRRKLIEMTDQILLPMQLGGRVGVSCDFATHFTREFFLYAAVERKSSLVVFTNIKSAFYNVIRQAIINSIPSFKAKHDHSCKQLFDRLGMPTHTRNVLNDKIFNKAVLESAGIDPYMCRLIGSFLDNTFFSFRDIAEIVVTEKGSMPGDTMADLIFNLYSSQIIHDIQLRLKQAGVTTELAWTGKASFVSCDDEDPPDAEQESLDVCSGVWVDDFAFAAVVNKTEDVIQTTKIIAKTAHDVCAGYGMKLSYGKKKTQAVLSMRGKSAKDIARALHVEDKGEIKFYSEVEERDICINAVYQYQHLGCEFDHKGSMKPEITKRSAMGREATSAISRFVLKNPDIPDRTKANATQAISLSKNTYGCQSWFALNKGEFRLFHNGIMNVYRRMTMGKYHKDNMDDDAVCASLRVSKPIVVLHVARLRYLSRLVMSAPTTLWALMQVTKVSSRSFYAAISQAIQWLISVIPVGIIELEPDADPVSAAIDVIVNSKKRWNKIVSNARAFDIQKMCNNSQASRFDRHFHTLANEAGMKISRAKIEISECSNEHECQICNTTFRDYQSLCAHKALRHGIKHPSRAYVDSSVCRFCLMCFHTRSSLIRHYKYSSSRCFGRLFYLNKLSQERINQLDQEENTRLKKTKGKGPEDQHPAYCIPGPLEMCSEVVEVVDDELSVEVPADAVEEGIHEAIEAINKQPNRHTVDLVTARLHEIFESADLTSPDSVFCETERVIDELTETETNGYQYKSIWKQRTIQFMSSQGCGANRTFSSVSNKRQPTKFTVSLPKQTRTCQ